MKGKHLLHNFPLYGNESGVLLYTNADVSHCSGLFWIHTAIFLAIIIPETIVAIVVASIVVDGVHPIDHKGLTIGPIERPENVYIKGGDKATQKTFKTKSPSQIKM